MRENKKVYASIKVLIMVLMFGFVTSIGINAQEEKFQNPSESECNKTSWNLPSHFNEFKQLFTCEELRDLVEAAPSHLSTRHTITLTEQPVSDTTLSLWIWEFHALGGSNAFELEVIRLINIERTENGLSPLPINLLSMKSARFISQGMVDLHYYSHISPVYGNHRNIANLFGVSRAIDNIHAYVISPEQVVQDFMNSEPHRKTLLLEEAVSIGVGVIETDFYLFTSDGVRFLGNTGVVYRSNGRVAVLIER